METVKTTLSTNPINNMFGFGKEKFNPESYEGAKNNLEGSEERLDRLHRESASQSAIEHAQADLGRDQSVVEKMQGQAGKENIETIDAYKKAKLEAFLAIMELNQRRKEVVNLGLDKDANASATGDIIREFERVYPDLGKQM